MLNFLKLGRPMNCGYIATSVYGDKRPYDAWGLVKQHEGIDLAPLGLKQRDGVPMAIAAYRGWVSGRGYDPDYMGHWVQIAHSAQGSAEPFWTQYNHLGGVIPGVGDFLEKGATLGRVSDTGNATGRHLHFMLMVQRRQKLIAIDPRKFMPWDDVQMTLAR